MAEIMFETLEVPAYYLATEPVLSLFSTGRITGAVLESGDGATHIVSVFQGPLLGKTAAVRNYLSGHDLTDYLRELLKQELLFNWGPSERESITEMKERLCYVGLYYEAEWQVLPSAYSLHRLKDIQ